MAAPPVDKLRELLDQATALVESNPHGLGDSKTRQELSLKLRKLNHAVEPASHQLAGLAWLEPCYMGVHLADDLKIFDLIAKGPHTTGEIASATGAEELLIVRIMRTVAALGLAKRTGPQTYEASAMTEMMCWPSVKAGIKVTYDYTLAGLLKAPEVLKDLQYRAPRTALESPFTRANNPDLDYYHWYASDPKKLNEFMVFIHGMFGQQTSTPWWKWFPIKDLLLADSERKQSDYLFIDVGGARGDEAQAVLKLAPELAEKGRFALQDLPEMIQAAKGSKLDPRIEPIPHDFFTPQPVIGARVYYLQNIMHNWSDGQCVEILEHLRHAMTPGYSKILIANLIVPESDAPLWVYGLDMQMLNCFAGAERGEYEWTKLLRAAGFEDIKMHYPPELGDAIIELTI